MLGGASEVVVTFAEFEAEGPSSVSSVSSVVHAFLVRRAGLPAPGEMHPFHGRLARRGGVGLDGSADKMRTAPAQPDGGEHVFGQCSPCARGGRRCRSARCAAARASAAQGSEDRRDLRLHRPVRRRRLAGRRPGHQDRHRHDQRARRRRGLQDRPHLRGRPIQSRSGDQRGDPPARPGEGQPGDGPVLQRALRAAGAEGRRGQEVHVGERVHRLQRLQGQEPAVRVPSRRCTPTSSAPPPARSSTRTPSRS